MHEILINSLPIYVTNKELALARLERIELPFPAVKYSQLRKYKNLLKLPRQYQQLKKSKFDLLEEKKIFCMVIPVWLLNILPSIDKTRILTAAAILGTRINGCEVNLGQVEIDKKSIQGKNFKSITLRFLDKEIQQLTDFGYECRLTKRTSIIRTSIFLGLNIPFAKEGIINSPEEYLEEWKKESVCEIEFLERIMILGGTMSRELFKRRGCAVFNALLYYRDKGGMEELKKQLSYILDWSSDRIVYYISDLLDRHQQNICDAKVLYKRESQRLWEKTKAQRQTAIAKAEGNV